MVAAEIKQADILIAALVAQTITEVCIGQKIITGVKAGKCR